MARVTIKDLGTGGIVRDQEGYELPPNVVTDANNVRFYQGWATTFSGNARVINPSVAIYGLAAYATVSTRYLVYAGLAKVFVHDGTTETEITPTSAPTGASTDIWTFGTLNGVLVANNQKDAPWYWGGSTSSDLTALTGWNTGWRAKALRPFKNYLVAMNITKDAGGTPDYYPHMVKWSHVADPGAIPTSWDETDATKDAGENDLAETPDRVVDGLPLGDVFIVYKERSAYGMQYIGPPFIWRFYRLPGELGMLTQNCAAATPMGHVVLAQGDVYLHNGGEPKSIIDQRMRNWLFDTIDPTNYSASFVVANPRTQEVWVCFPEVGQSVCTKALVWSWANDTVALRDLDDFRAGCTGVLNYAGTAWSDETQTWDQNTDAWNEGSDFNTNDSRLFMASATSGVGIQGMDTTSEMHGASYTSYIERRGLHFDAPDRVKHVQRVWPRIDAAAGTEVTIEIGSSMDPEGEPTWGTAQTFTVGTDQKVDVNASGRYLAYRISSTARWRMRAMDWDLTTRGRW